jgi:cytochrome c peroxidase
VDRRQATRRLRTGGTLRAAAVVALVYASTQVQGKSSPLEGLKPDEIELGIVAPIYPEGLPPSPEASSLGEKLFFDPVLSGDGTISCATCHDPKFAFADSRPVSEGVSGRKGRRNSPTLWNAALFEHLSWDGSHLSLEAQSLAAISNPDEMNLERRAIAEKVRPRHGRDLMRLFGEVSDKSVAKALGAYQRTLLAGNAPADRYLYQGESEALSTAAKRGLTLFLGEARCVQCHFIRSQESHPFGGSTALYTDDRFHNIGIGYRSGVPADRGRAEATGDPRDTGAFKTPTLRNIELTPPYMHDGSMKTLEEVIEHYNKGGIPNAHLDFDIRPLELTDREKADLLEFLKSLTSDKLKQKGK